MYDFKIKDEPFARGYLSADSHSKYVRTGRGYLEAIKSVQINFDPETGFPELDFGQMACGSCFSSGQSPYLWLLQQKAENMPEHSEDYNYIIENMSHLELGQYWSSFSGNE